MPMNWALNAIDVPLLVLPPAAASLDEAHAAIELWEHYSGKTLDPDQRLVVEVMMAEDAAGLWAASTTGREKPRQNGKGDEVEVVELWGLVHRAEPILHTVHDAVLLATQAQQRLLAVLDKPDLRRRVLRAWKGVGQQMIEMRNGGVIFYRTRTAGGGRGVDDVARVVVDEAQHATEEHIEAITPTMLANPNPQMNAMGTSGLAGRSSWWWEQRKRALLNDPGSFGYVGHTAELGLCLDGDGKVVQPPVDVTDRKVWALVNPAIQAGRGRGMVFLEEQLLRMGAAGFAREHLGVWDPPPDEAASHPFPLAWWDRGGEGDNAGATHSGVPVLVVDVSPDRAWAAIVAVGASSVEGKMHVEVQRREPGTDWVMPALEGSKLAARAGVVLDGGGQAASLVPDLEAAKIPVVVAKLADVRQACSRSFDALRDDRVTHRSDPVLAEALRNAVKVASGDAWTIRRRDSAEDITALFGFVLGVWGFEAAERPTPKPVFAY